MTILIQSHGGEVRRPSPTSIEEVVSEALVPADGDIAVDEAADFGYLFPPSGDPGDYLPDDAVDDLDTLGGLMVGTGDDLTPGSNLPTVMTYWGQFLDHELTARTDREGDLTRIETPVPLRTAAEIEQLLKNARSPRFDLDTVYGGPPIGPLMPKAAARLLSGMRHPVQRAKMRVGTALTGDSNDPVPDGLDPHRDLPRFAQVEQPVRDAYLEIAEPQMTPADFAALQANLPSRALIGDKRNEENLIVAQFHLSFLRFHNRVVDFLTDNDTGWLPEWSSARDLTRLHYQWLVVEVYLKTVCDPAVVDAVLAAKARHFFEFRDAYYARNPNRTLGNALPLEFSVAGFRFGHTMVRGAYDYNRNFGRATAAGPSIIPSASFDLIFAFTANGKFGAAAGAPAKPKLPANWIIDWSRFVTADTSFPEEPQRSARALDTALAPPLGTMINEGNDPGLAPDFATLLKHLARRNLRRGLSLRLPTGQALHQHVHAAGGVASSPIADVGALVAPTKPELADFLRTSASRMHERTPLWFYLLAEAEAAGGNHLGELGSWLVASTFVAVMLSDPDSALSRDFTPDQSPVTMPDGSVIDTLEKWLRFAIVLE